MYFMDVWTSWNLPPAAKLAFPLVFTNEQKTPARPIENSFRKWIDNDDDTV